MSDIVEQAEAALEAVKISGNDPVGATGLIAALTGSLSAIRDEFATYVRFAEAEINDAEPDADYVPAPRNYEKCDSCGDVRTLRHHCDLEARLTAVAPRLRAFAANCVKYGDMTPAAKRMLERIAAEYDPTLPHSRDN